MYLHLILKRQPIMKQNVRAYKDGSLLNYKVVMFGCKQKRRLLLTGKSDNIVIEVMLKSVDFCLQSNHTLL